MGSMNPERDNNIFEMREAGHEYPEIAERFGVSKTRAQQIVETRKRFNAVEARLPSRLTADSSVSLALDFLRRTSRVSCLYSVINADWGGPKITLGQVATILNAGGPPKTYCLGKKGIKELIRICADAGCDLGEEKQKIKPIKYIYQTPEGARVLRLPSDDPLEFRFVVTHADSLPVLISIGADGVKIRGQKP